MIQRKGIAYTALLLTVLLAPGQLQADMTYYSVTGSASPNPIGTDGNVLSSLNNNQGVLFVSLPAGHTTIYKPIYINVGGQSIVTLYAFNNDPQRTTVTFNKVPFTSTMDLQQFNPFMEAKETYRGFLRGTVDFATHSSTLVADIIDAAPRNVYFGPIRYYFVVDYSHPLQWDPTLNFPGTSTPGAFWGEIDARFYLGNSPVTGPAATPEPSCLVLAGMGLVTVAGATWQKRRRQKVS